MKKIIRAGEKGKADIVVETDGSLWRFMAGDIIRQDGNPEYYPKFYYEVLGFRFGEQLWVRNVETGEASKLSEVSKYSELSGTREDIFYFESPRDLILISRPGLNFRVGDQVKMKVSRVFPGLTGRIAAIDPESHTIPYLVVFDFEEQDGQTNAEVSWDRPWFPKSHKFQKRKYLWVGEDSVEEMMKRVIYDNVGRQIEVEVEGELWGFKTDDIIVDENEDENKRFVVQGFRDGKLWVYGENYGIGAKPLVKPDGLLLIERAGLKFKVGDIVKIISGLGMDSVGKVAVIDPNAAEKELNNKPAYPYYIENIKTDLAVDGYEAGRMENPWYPKINKTGKRRVMCGEHELEKWTAEKEAAYNAAKEKTDEDLNSAPNDSLKDRTSKLGKWPDSAGSPQADLIEIKDEWPEWLKETVLRIKAGVSHFFILWGNIYDLQKYKDAFVPVEQILVEILGDGENARAGKVSAMFYSISKGLYFEDAGAETKFRERYLGKTAETTEPQSEAEKIAAAGKRAQQEAPLSEIIGKGPDKVFPFLEKFVLTEKSGPKILIVNSAHNAAPTETGTQDRYDRETIEMLEYWARDAKIREAGGVVFLLTPHLVDIADGLRAPHSGTTAVKIPKPNEEERTAQWKRSIEKNATETKDDLNAKTLGRITNGLSLKHIIEITSLAKVKKIPLDLVSVKKKKQEILETEFSGDVLRVMVPEFGFDYFGNMENIKKYMLEIKDNLLKGVLRRVPMGILASGPPGTGKTFFFECFAYECGYNFVKIVNPQEMWVGASEKRMAKILSTLDDVSPVIVVEDEADQSEAPRGSPVGDSGVSNRLRQMKFEFCSDPKRRGKVIWVRITNRPDLIDAAYKRKGRSDDHIAFVMPNADACAKIFETVIKRHKIPATISDFSLFGEKAAEKIYCTGADIEWMALEADKIAGREGKEKAGKKHFLKTIESWKPKTRPEILDHQIILALEEADENLKPDDWEKMLAEAYRRKESRK